VSGPHRLADYDPAGTPCNDAKTGLRELLRQPARGFVDKRCALPTTPPRPNHHRKRFNLMRYEDRST